jgi:hypothetical protein
MKRQRPTKVPLRPWMLGTDDIPPPMDVPWQMWSKSSNPYEQGLVQFEFTPEGLAVQWWGPHETRYVITWNELGIMAELPPKLAEDVQWIKEQAEMDGFKAGLERAEREFDQRTKGPQFVGIRPEFKETTCPTA